MESERLEDRGEAASHFRRHRALQFVGSDLAANHVAMEGPPELAETQPPGPLPCNFIQAGEQLVFTVEAAVAVILDVIGVIEFARDDVLVPDAPVARER